MIPTMQMLTRLQRVGYVLSLLLVGAGWLLFLGLITEWPPVQWSRPTLALQAMAVVLIYPLAHRLPTRRLLVYPLIIAGGIYLWDSTLPPPSLPYGPLRVFIPSLILLGLLFDCVMTMWYIQYLRRRTIQIHDRSLRLEDAALLLGVSTEQLRAQLQQHERVIGVDDMGRETITLNDLRLLVAHERRRHG